MGSRLRETGRGRSLWQGVRFRTWRRSRFRFVPSTTKTASRIPAWVTCPGAIGSRSRTLAPFGGIAGDGGGGRFEADYLCGGLFQSETHACLEGSRVPEV